MKEKCIYQKQQKKWKNPPQTKPFLFTENPYVNLLTNECLGLESEIRVNTSRTFMPCHEVIHALNHWYVRGHLRRSEGMYSELFSKMEEKNIPTCFKKLLVTRCTNFKNVAMQNWLQVQFIPASSLPLDVRLQQYHGHSLSLLAFLSLWLWAFIVSPLLLLPLLPTLLYLPADVQFLCFRA